jgi:hypothetical protein
VAAVIMIMMSTIRSHRHRLVLNLDIGHWRHVRTI